MDEVLELLDKIVKKLQNRLEEAKSVASKKATTYAQVLQSSTTTQEQKNQIALSRNIELEQIDRITTQLSLLYSLQIFAFKVKVLEVSVGNISKQITHTETIQKNSEMEDVKKNIDALKILVEAQHEAMKQVHEDQKTLNYIH
ncbi:MAG: hypothetical protein LBE76_00390 [Nitrososphaerota archaeon]|nr:hypothetical protein [Nitrososphaerota archaeon]